MPERASIRVPATSANLGCLFDCGAIALSLYLDVAATPREDPSVSVTYRGETPERVTADESNLIAVTLGNLLSGWGLATGFDLEIDNQIPVGVGLGSSAAAIVAGIMAAHRLADRPLVDQEILSLASSIEDHPDNVGAAWEGGFTLTAQLGDVVSANHCAVPDSIRFALVVPDYALPTEKARAALPAGYSRADAVHNLQRAASLVAEFFSGRDTFRRELFDDRWHQPFRSPLVPGLEEALSLRHPDVLGVCLSGAGPSILALVRGRAEPVAEELAQILARHGVGSRPFAVSADNRGAKGWGRTEGRGL